MPLLILVEITHKADKTISSIHQLLSCIGIHTTQLTNTQKLFSCDLSLLLLRVVFRQIKIFKLHGGILTDFVFDGFCFVHEVLQSRIIVMNHILLSLLRFPRLLFEFNLFKHIDLFFKHVVDKQLYESGNMSRDYLVRGSREERDYCGVIVEVPITSYTFFPLLSQEFQLFLPQGLTLVTGFFQAMLELETWLLGSSNFLMAFGPIVGGVLILVKYNHFLSILLLVFDTVFLNLALQLDEVLALLFNLLEPLLISLFVLYLFLLFFLNELLQLFNLGFLLAFQLQRFSFDVVFVSRDFSDGLLSFFPRLGSQAPLFLGEGVFPEVAIKDLNFSIVDPDLLVLPRASLRLEMLSLGLMMTALPIFALRDRGSLGYLFLLGFGKGTLGRGLT